MVQYKEDGQVDLTSMEMVAPEVYENYAFHIVLRNGQIGYTPSFTPDGMNGIWCYVVTKYQVTSISGTSTKTKAEECFPSWIPIQQIESVEINNIY